MNVISFKNPIQRTANSYDGVQLIQVPRFDCDWCLIHLMTRRLEIKRGSFHQTRRIYEWMVIAEYGPKPHGLPMSQVAHEGLSKYGISLRAYHTEYYNPAHEKRPGRPSYYCAHSGLQITKSRSKKIKVDYKCTEWQNSWFPELSKLPGSGPCACLPQADGTVQYNLPDSLLHIPFWTALNWFDIRPALMEL